MRAMSVVTAGVLAGVVGSAMVAPAAAHPYGWHIGQDGNGDIKVDFLWDLAHHAWYSDPAYDGVYFDGLNFEEWAQPDPANDYFAMDPGAKIVVEIVSFDAGVFLWDPDDLARGPLSAPGTQYALGTTGTAFAKSALWQIDNTAPGFDPNQHVWGASMKFIDLTGTYGDSPVYTFLMEPTSVPAPAGVAAFGALGVLGARRRR